MTQKTPTKPRTTFRKPRKGIRATSTKSTSTKIRRKSAPVARHVRAWHTVRGGVANTAGRINRRVQGLKSRRPHRSFRRTRRRDYVRPFKVPGYFELTINVWQTIWKNRLLYAGLMIVYGLLMLLTGAAVTQTSYTATQDSIKQAGENIMGGNFSGFMQSATTFAATMVDMFDPSRMDGVQQFYVIIFTILTWLTTVWLLRALMAGRRPKLRDGLYNSGAPLISTIFVASLLVVQLLPIAVAIIVYSVLQANDMLTQGFEVMLFQILAFALTTLSMYWITSTFIALVVVTLPGMYPMQAIRTAGDLVIGRRLRILLRLLWAMMLIIGTWLLVVVPTILFDEWLKATWSVVSSMPIVPVVLLTLVTGTITWMATYVYILYRGMVDDGAKPA